MAEKKYYTRQSRGSMHRGGYRRSDHRSEYLPGPDGWTNASPAAAPRPPAKAGDLTHFRKINNPTAMSFGRSSVFAGRREGKGGQDSPSLARAKVPSNMFSMLPSDYRSEYSRGPDGWTNVAPAAAPRPPAKSGDLTHFGKVRKPTAMSFGPSSIFAGKKEGKRGRDSPSLSRANSSSNMFSMLSSAEAFANASGLPSRKTSVDLTQSGIPTEGGGRKRLQLLPRSKPLNDDTGKVDDEAAPDSSDEDADTDAAPSMTENQAKAKVDEDLKELLSVRDIRESESYFSSLPSQYRHILVDKIFSKVLDSKEADIKLAADVFARAVEKAVCSQEEFEQGLAPTMEFLDDICVDAPAAYSVAARLLKATALPQSSVQNLASKIAFEGDDSATQPADKLMKEFTALS